MESWLSCQINWMYLEPIFSSEDLKKKLPLEKKLFDNVDYFWRNLMESIEKDKYIFETLDWEKLLNDLKKINQQLDEI